LNSVNQSEYIRKENGLYIVRKGSKNKISQNHELLSKVCNSLRGGRCVVIFYFDIAQFHEIEQIAGFESAQRIINLFNETLARGLKELYKKKVRILASESLWGDDFIVFAETTNFPNLTTLEYLSTAYRKQINERMNKEFLRLTGRDIDVHIGYAIITDSVPNAEMQLYNATKRAFGIAKGFINMQSVKYLPEFKDILKRKKLNSVYQPIISIRSAAILGWEALIRGPENSYFQSPDNIFSFAEAEGLLFPLEKICRESALNNLGELGPDQKIFVNVHPNTINDPAFTEGETIRILQNLCIKPQNVVFEITERHHIKDFISLNKTLTHYRDQGFLVAVDDLGCGFSNLQSIAEIRPDYIKIDISLVRGIHKDGVKKALMETFVTFADKIGSEIIAEGIEEEAEMAALVNIGVHYGQGYFFGKPTYPKQIAPEEAYLKTLHFVNNGRYNILKHAFPIGDIIDKTVSIDEQTMVKDVKAIFEGNTTLSGIVVVENNKPCGLVMRHHLDKHLGRKYGYALYSEKPISKIMNKNPLVVANSTPVELVSQIAMNRNKMNLYDNIIVTRDESLQGVVSVQILLDTMTRIRLELAKGANPLTGLPGNIAIEQEHFRCAKNDKPFSVIFIDLDNFKSYNDKYGFEKGDEVLIYTADILKNGLEECCKNDNFLGHIGGDDFIIFTTDDAVDSLCSFLIEKFDSGIKDLYNFDDREAGGIIAYDRSGQQRWFPFISVSIAVIDCTAETGKDMKDISGNGAKLKQYAKSIPGSLYVRDRRS
jgi:EAL domain-containing protein (putative c-di-GMP-specific phosphodiesterase class I)/GGDEF domain-containing protein